MIAGHHHASWPLERDRERSVGMIRNVIGREIIGLNGVFVILGVHI